MPAGDQITRDWQLELKATLHGAGTSFLLGTEIAGLDVPEAKTNDHVLGHARGSYLGRDYTAARVITIPYILKGTPAVVGDNFWDLTGVWAASETDLTLHMRLPGYGKFVVTGRPRALIADFAYLNVGHIRALATFVCGDPTITRVA